MLQTVPLAVDSRETLCLGGDVVLRGLFSGECVRVIQFRCLNDGVGLRTPRQQSWPALTVEFQGISEVVSERRRVVIDPVHAVAHSAHVPYATRHPWGCRCRGCSYSIRPDLAEEVFAPRLRFVSQRQAATPVSIGLTNADLLYTRRMWRALSSTPACDPLAIEESLLDWLAGVGQERATEARRTLLRPETRRRHRRLVAQARGFLTEHCRHRVHLNDLAQALHSSAPHVTRVFRRETGLTLHRYLTRVRLVAALDAVAAGEDDLSALALECGFSNHSHMTAAFRREFGLTPSTWRVKNRLQLERLRQRVQA